MNSQHTHAPTQSPLPGHFALKRPEKLMRVQSFITLETEWERETARVIQCPPFAAVAMETPHLTVGTHFGVSPSSLSHPVWTKHN